MGMVNLRVIFRKYFPIFWLVNHPFFWSKKERIDFIMGLQTNLKQDVWAESKLERTITRYASLGHWTTMVQGEVFMKILNRPKVMKMKPYNLNHPIQIIRFMTACYKHVNDKGNIKPNEVNSLLHVL